MTTNKPTPERFEGAIEQLKNHQQQLDMDGIMVGVSRQALEEVLSYVTEPRPSELRQAGADELDGGTRNRVSMLHALGFKHTKENGDHVVTGHGREYRHTSLLCLAQRIRDDFLAQPAAQKTEGEPCAWLLMEGGMYRKATWTSGKEEADLWIEDGLKVKPVYAALASRATETDMVPRSEYDAVCKDLERMHDALNEQANAPENNRASVDVDYEQEGDDWIEVCEAYDQHQIERDHSPIETGSERLFLHTILDFLASQNRLIKPKKD